MIVLIVAIVFGAKLMRTQMVLRARMDARASEDGVVSGAMQAQINRLTERVAVLEKLVTDDDRRLAREIDALRDARTAPL
jgi:hypothetical protein